MPTESITAVPKYCLQRKRGRAELAYVCSDGKKYPLGASGYLEIRARYTALIGKPQTKPPSKSITITVSLVLAACIERTKEYDPKSKERRTTAFDLNRCAFHQTPVYSHRQ